MIGLLGGGLWKYLAVAIAIAVTFGLVYAKGRADGASVVQAEFDGYRLTQASLVQKAYEQARATELENNRRIQNIKERERETLRTADAKHRAAIERLRQQTTGNRGAGVSGDSASLAAACAESRLAEGDGGMVVRPTEADLRFPLDYSADVAKLQAALDSCVEQYDVIYSSSFAPK